MSFALPHLRSGWAVDQALQDDENFQKYLQRLRDRGCPEEQLPKADAQPFMGAGVKSRDSNESLFWLD